MAGSFEQKLRELIEPIVQSYDLELWGLRFNNGRSHAYLQIFVDSADGVDAEICGDIANALSPVMDAADLIEPAYTLEVSSPGLDRLLFTLEQISRYIGHEIKVELKMPQQNRGTYTGKLIAVNDDVVVLQMSAPTKGKKAKSKLSLATSKKDETSVNSNDDSSQDRVEIVYSNIKSARLVPDFSNLNLDADA